jgi:hypothetical protein
MNKDRVYSCTGEDAAAYGLPAAVILHHIRWWISKNEANDKHFHDGRYWTYNSTKAFAKLFPFLTKHQIRRALDRLVDEGVLVKGNYNTSSYDRTLWYALGDGDQHLANLPNGVGRNATPIPDSKQITALSEPTASDGAKEFGFGMAPPKNTSPATKFDIDTATRLLEGVRHHLGAAHAICRRARISSWANHIRLLRTTDKVSERRIERVLGWYVAHMGEEFIPEAYAGESFRKKFFAIEKAHGRDITTAVQVGPEAAVVAGRLAGMGWPKGSAEAVPAATQACFTAYEQWLADRTTFMDRLRRDDLVDDYGGERGRLLKLGEHLTRAMPPPSHFVQEWMTDVNERVRGWDEWGGELAPFIFKPDTKRFRAMGRGMAKDFCHDADRWDRFCEVMKKELS